MSQTYTCQAQPTDGELGILLDGSVGKGKVQQQHKAPYSELAHHASVLRARGSLTGCNAEFRATSHFICDSDKFRCTDFSLFRCG